MIGFSRLVSWLSIIGVNLFIPVFAQPDYMADITLDHRDNNYLKGVSMAECKANFVKMSDMNRRAFMQASGVVADEDRQSFPIPVIQHGEPWIIYLFSPSLARPKAPTKMSPPTYTIQLNASTGKLKKLLTVTPRDFNQKHETGEMIGELAMPAGLSFEDFTRKRDRLYELYDELLPVYFANCKIEDSTLHASAKEFKQLFDLLSESPLWPYYRSVGGNFFDWISENQR